MTALPWYLWAAGAAAVGVTFRYDRARCHACGRWSREPAEYPDGRILCARHHGERVETAREWATRCR